MRAEERRLSSSQEQLESNAPGKKWKMQMKLFMSAVNYCASHHDNFVIHSLRDGSANCNYCRNLKLDGAALPPTLPPATPCCEPAEVLKNQLLIC